LNVSPSINSSRLRRVLGDATGLGAEVPSQDLAQGLGQWLGACDAMTLHGTLQAVQALADAPAAAQVATQTEASTASAAAGLRALDAAFLRLRTGLVRAITVGEAPVAAGGWRGGAPRGAPQPVSAVPAVSPDASPGPEAAPDYGAFHKRYLDLQRQMELRMGPFRAHVREVLAAASTPLRQLAALDAVLEQMLGPREQRLMGTVPVFLERRFEALRQAPPATEAASLCPPRAWVAQFEHEFQQVLLAELNSRLQPVVGMMEAFSRALEPTLKMSLKKTQ
jgi:hypothetical protein